MITEGLDLLERGLGLKPGQSRLVIRIGWVAFVTAHILWVCGFLAGLGIASPFAKAEESKAVNDMVLDLRVQILETSLLDARLRQCKADTPETKQYYYERLQEKMNQYFNITGRNYKPPQCAEIL